ncbi:MAG: RagB/SusD family nutrient uptake outer membrane protein, partial [Prevotella sp.]|nr:RagB/SusD family nutrient uptake outer membrane protein [Prevotella sp.]
NEYLESIKNDKEKMRELIRNERRLELCFENHRFWDLRRWQANLNETAKGVNITTNASTGNLNYGNLDVEKRDYKDYMYYGPIPYSEVLKWSNLQQNDGWK